MTLTSQDQELNFKSPRTSDWTPNITNSVLISHSFKEHVTLLLQRSKWIFRTLYLMLTILSRRRHLQRFSRVQSVKPSEDDIITSLPVALSGPLPGCRALYYGSHCSSGQKQKSWTPAVSKCNPNKTIFNATPKLI